MRIGYACLNFHVKKAGHGKRTMQKAPFLADQAAGYPKLQEIIFDNIRYLHEVMSWNKLNKIHLFRFSHFAPFMTEYRFEDLPQFERIKSQCQRLGEIILQDGHRLTNHPGQFAVLCSPRDNVNQNTINELNKVGQIFDLLGLPSTPFSKINIHIGGVYGDKKDTLKRFCDNFSRLDPAARNRITIENDDRPNGYTVEDLVEGIYQTIGVPIVFDDFHHKLNPGRLTAKQALEMAYCTWPAGIQPVMHHSDSRADHEDPESDPVAHSEKIYTRAQTADLDIDLILEAKGCENAVLDYQTRWPS